MERTERLLILRDYCPFLFIQMGKNCIAWHSMEHIKSDYMARGKMVKVLGVQVVFLSVFPVEAHDLGRNRRMLKINNWLCRWCHQEKFELL